MVEYVKYENKNYAIIVSQDFNKGGVHFFTKDEMPQQLGFMSHSKGTKIQPHRHIQVKREIFHTQEVLFIKKGKIRLDIFSEDEKFLGSKVLKKNDVILLIQGGHGFEVLEDVEMFEVKQGPYIANKDKIHFNPIK